MFTRVPVLNPMQDFIDVMRAIPALSLRLVVVFAPSTTAKGAKNFVLSCEQHVGWDSILLSLSKTSGWMTLQSYLMPTLRPPLVEQEARNTVRLNCGKSGSSGTSSRMLQVALFCDRTLYLLTSLNPSPCFFKVASFRFLLSRLPGPSDGPASRVALLGARTGLPSPEQRVSTHTLAQGRQGSTSQDEANEMSQDF